MTWFPERIERVCRQPPERCRDLAWLHRGLSTVSDTASRRSWRQRLDRRPADKRPSGGSSPGNGHGVGARRTTRRRGRPHAPRAGPTLTSIGMLLAGFGLALRHRDQRWRSLRCPPTRGRQALSPSWRCQPPRRSWLSYAGTPRRSPLTENDVRVPAHGVRRRAVGTRRLQSRRRVCSPGVMRTTSRGTFGLPALLTTASTNRSSGRDARGYRWFLDPALRRRTRPRKRRLADRLRACPRRRRAAGREELWRRIRGHHSRDRAFPGWVSGDWWWSARRPIGASAPGRTVPWLGATTRPSSAMRIRRKTRLIGRRRRRTRSSRTGTCIGHTRPRRGEPPERWTRRTSISAARSEAIASAFTSVARSASGAWLPVSRSGTHRLSAPREPLQRQRSHTALRRPDRWI
jgi:hypothetical protein